MSMAKMDDAEPMTTEASFLPSEAMSMVYEQSELSTVTPRQRKRRNQRSRREQVNSMVAGLKIQMEQRITASQTITKSSILKSERPMTTPKAQGQGFQTLPITPYKNDDKLKTEMKAKEDEGFTRTGDSKAYRYNTEAKEVQIEK